MPTTLIDTSRVANWRKLDFQTAADALADAEMLVEAEREGRITALGNWSLGQALGHVAAWASYAYDGYPSTPPWFVRLIGPLLKRSVFKGSLPRGYRLPGVPGGTFATDEMPADEGLSRMRSAFARLEAEPPAIRNPVFGRLTHEEWMTLNLRHAALHQGFFRVDA